MPVQARTACSSRTEAAKNRVCGLFMVKAWLVGKLPGQNCPRSGDQLPYPDQGGSVQNRKYYEGYVICSYFDNQKIFINIQELPQSHFFFFFFLSSFFLQEDFLQLFFFSSFFLLLFSFLSFFFAILHLLTVRMWKRYCLGWKNFYLIYLGTICRTSV